MRFFDAHCDTVLPELQGEGDFLSGQGGAHVDLPRLLDAGSCVQLFAIFAARSQLPDADLPAAVELAASTIRGWAERSNGRMGLALSAADLQAACRGEGFRGMLGLEGADALEGDPGSLAHFYDLGVRNLIPAWDDNAFSGTAFGSGGPLTRAGIELVEMATDLRMMVDVSHLSDAAFERVREVVKGPFIASHSNCRELCPHPRNLTDPMIHSIADHGGVMGINLAAYFLDPLFYRAWDAVNSPIQASIRAASDPAVIARLKDERRARSSELPLPSVEWVSRHVIRAIRKGGEDAVGLGGDLDGIEVMPAGLSGIEDYPSLADLFRGAGLTERQVEKVCWRNMARVFQEVLA